MTRFKPTGDRLLVKPSRNGEVVRDSGLVIPATASEKAHQGTVVEIGPGRLDENGKRVPIEVALGATVLYSRYGGVDVKLDDEDYLVLRETDVLGQIEEDGYSGEPDPGPLALEREG